MEAPCRGASHGTRPTMGRRSERTPVPPDAHGVRECLGEPDRLPTLCALVSRMALGRAGTSPAPRVVGWSHGGTTQGASPTRREAQGRVGDLSLGSYHSGQTPPAPAPGQGRPPCPRTGARPDGREPTRRRAHCSRRAFQVAQHVHSFALSGGWSGDGVTSGTHTPTRRARGVCRRRSQEERHHEARASAGTMDALPHGGALGGSIHHGLV